MRHLLLVPLWASAVLGGFAGAAHFRAKGWTLEDDLYTWHGLTFMVLLMVFLIGFFLTLLLIVKEYLKEVEERPRPKKDGRRLMLEHSAENVAYLYMRGIEPGEAEIQIPVAWKIGGGPQLILDLTPKGELLGIEFLDAEAQLGGVK